MPPPIATPCAHCGCQVAGRPTLVEFHGQQIYLFDPVLCAACLLGACEKWAVPCANCGELIPPFSQVGVLKGENNQTSYVHMTAACSTTGSAFHGYLGKGTVGGFLQIEAC